MLLHAFVFCLVITWATGAPGPDPDVSVKIKIKINGDGEGKDGSSRPYCENCGKGGEEGSKNRIVGGIPAGSAKRWPWQAWLIIEDEMYSYTCGGSIIKKNWILTAGHCLFDTKVVKLEVYLGLYNTSDTAGSHLTEHIGESAVNSVIFIHKDYNETTLDNDIALIKLKNDLDFKDTIQPVCLAYAEDILIPGSAVVTGWGTTSFGGNTSDILLQVTLDNLDTVKCRELYQIVQEPVTENQICSRKPNKDSCQGDSGGALVTKLNDGRWAQIGIVSWGFGCADPLYPGVYTKLPNYYQWINEISGSSTC